MIETMLPDISFLAVVYGTALCKKTRPSPDSVETQSWTDTEMVMIRVSSTKNGNRGKERTLTKYNGQGDSRQWTDLKLEGQSKGLH
jgi:hypothetical protein